MRSSKAQSRSLSLTKEGLPPVKRPARIMEGVVMGVEERSTDMLATHDSHMVPPYYIYILLKYSAVSLGSVLRSG